MESQAVRWMGMARSLAQKWPAVPEDVEDRISIAYLALARAEKTWDECKGAFSTYARKYILCAFDHSIRHNGRKKRPRFAGKRKNRAVGVEEIRSLEALECEDANPARSASLKEAASKALGTLTEPQREVVSLYYGFDPRGPMEYKEVAITLGITRNQVQNHRRRAFEAMRVGLSGREKIF